MIYPSDSFVFLCPLLALIAVISGCKPAAKTSEKPAADVAPQVVGEPTVPEFHAAKDQMPYEALPLLMKVLKANPTSSKTRDSLAKILQETVWNLPEITIKHSAPIDQMAATGTSSLWVSLAGKVNTSVRWNLETMAIESVLFPTPAGTTRALILDPSHQSIVVERGEIALLCHAQTLKPVAELGRLPDFLTPSAVVVFSSNGLLMGHPSLVSEQDHSIIWHLRDTSSGQIIRSSKPLANDAAQPLAAIFDRAELRVIHSDGTLLEIPISPIKPVREIPMPEPVKLHHAQFSADGNAVLTLQSQEENQPPIQTIISYRDEEDGSLEVAELATRFAWSRQPNIWSSLMSSAENPPFSVDGKSLNILTRSHSRIELASPISAVVFQDQSVITGEENGTITVHRLLSFPEMRPSQSKPREIDSSALVSIENLMKSLAGTEYSEQENRCIPSTAEERVRAFRTCNLEIIQAVFPQLDFSSIISGFRTIQVRQAAAEAFLPLNRRLARADFTEKSEGGPARDLALALESDDPESIQSCLSSAVNLPPLLRQISLARIAWLQGRLADVVSSWPTIFPKLEDIRRSEDWDGWEQADFEPALENIHQCVSKKLNLIRIPENSTLQQRRAVATRLVDPAAVDGVGRVKYAAACLEAALVFSAYEEEANTAFRLATLARHFGSPPVPCLRVEAAALTILGAFQEAHLRWIELITEHPVEMQLAGDYTEAAYTAFENMDPGQAIEILNTGIRHFPGDSTFATRAGWIALLAGNSQEAYQFLLAGKRIGFPVEKIDEAMAMLTIAATRIGANDEATSYFQDLIIIDPMWADAKTLDPLDWPEEFKVILKQLMH